MGIKFKSKALLAKVEATYGVDAAPTAAANAILAMNVEISPMEGEDVSRDIERAAFGAEPMIPVGVHSKLTFDVELVGSGTLGAAPAWGPLMRMCAVAQTITAGTKVEYAPITGGEESGSIYFMIGATRHVLLGSRGTFSITANAQGIPMIRFTITGLFTVPSEQAVVTPDFTAWKTPQVATRTNTPTFTIGGVNMILREFSFDLGNDIQPRMLIGSETIEVVDRAEAVRCRVEAVPMTTYNPFQVAQNQTLQAIQLIHGTVASSRVRIDIPSAQQKRLTGYEEAQGQLEWPLEFTPLPVVANDQWKISLQ